MREVNGALIHSSSIIDEDVAIGAGSKIWHFCHILRGSVIGRDCVIGQGCCIGANVSIGNGCKIQNNVSIYEGVRLCDEVFVGPSVVFTNVLTPRAFINRKSEFLPTLLHKGCSIGANATILCGIEIGEFALIGAGSVVLESVPSYALMVGNPARPIGFVDRSGARLRFDKGGFARSIYDGRGYILENGVVREV